MKYLASLFLIPFTIVGFFFKLIEEGFDAGEEAAETFIDWLRSNHGNS